MLRSTRDLVVLVLVGVAPQHLVDEWSAQCWRLTTEWYGRPNLSTMYDWLLEVHHSALATPFRFSELLSARSRDKFIRITHRGSSKWLPQFSHKLCGVCDAHVNALKLPAVRVFITFSHMQYGCRKVEGL